MKKIFIVNIIAMLFILGTVGIGFPMHAEEKVIAKGTVTDIKAIEVELTVKDDQGKEVKVRTKEPAVFKIGDPVVIKDGKVKKGVKPITGGY